MKQVFEIKDRKIIQRVLDNAEYEILALCADNVPYSVPVNFVSLDNGSDCYLLIYHSEF